MSGQGVRNRYASTEDLARDLATVRIDLSEASSGSDASLGVKQVPRRRLRWIVAGALVLLAGGIGYLFAIKTSRAEVPRYTQLTFSRGTVWSAKFTPACAGETCTARAGRGNRCPVLDTAGQSRVRSAWLPPAYLCPLRATATWPFSWNPFSTVAHLPLERSLALPSVERRASSGDQVCVGCRLGSGWRSWRLCGGPRTNPRGTSRVPAR